MKEYIITYFKDLVILTNEMSPYILFGFLIAGVLYAFFPQKKVAKYLGKNNLSSVVNASLIGIPLPLCSCGVIPTGVSFYKNGASKGSAVSFLISTPQTGVDSIMVTYSMLGLPFAILRPIIAFISGIVGGLVTNKATFENSASPDKHIEESLEKKDTRNPITKIFHYGFIEFMEDIAKWLIQGLLIAALFSVLIPDDFFGKNIQNDLLGMLILLVASVPLYVCATSSVPIAAVLILKGLSPGAALVFLMAGPATNAATITVIGKSMGRKTLIAYLTTIILSAVAFGLIIDYLLPAEWFSLGIAGMHEHQHELLPHWLSVSSSIVLTALLLYAIFKKYFKPKTKIDTSQLKLSSDMEKTYIVKGMNCNHCKANVTNALTKIEGVEILNVDLDTESVTLKNDGVDAEKIKLAVEDIGYKFEGERG